MKIIRQLYTLNVISGKSELKERINRIVIDTLNPQNSLLRKSWDSFMEPLLKGYLSATSKYKSLSSMAFRIFGTLSGIYQLATLIDNIFD